MNQTSKYITKLLINLLDYLTCSLNKIRLLVIKYFIYKVYNENI